MSSITQAVAPRGAPVSRGPRAGVDGQALLAAAIFIACVALAVYGLFAQDRAIKVSVAEALQAPGPSHWFGADAQGRDVFARVAVGTGIAFLSGLIAVAIGGGLGLLVALLCGLGPRWLDAVLMRLADAVLAFPQFLLALAISMAAGASLQTAIAAIIVTVVPVFARTLRAEARRSVSEPFVEAARTIGVPVAVIAVRHVVPYVSTTLIVQMAANFGNVVLTLAGLSFVGLGAQPPTPEWGAMITEGLQNALSGQWWIGVFPGLALLIMVVGVNLLADRLPALIGARRAGRA
ncbi:ABC transporter permease [Microbacterium paludicola]|uniref:ABC transporter permease n=1 Tax=Microbacterium paludicola TaxID=300019 RepID=A0A4Y9FT04_9MICO|nr:ABC transporter permease [Microbacterium paludicola]MBF0817170.1 ABC transporter permease [Microbacterium paludicola]TFU32098.1 ABC transporter permease [Microbacterium paludicola]